MQFPGHFEVEATASRAGTSSFPQRARRPWSPINYDDDVTYSQGMHNYYSQDQVPGSFLRGSRQEASEDSIEALDLADYAQTLRRPGGVGQDSPYPPFPHTSHPPFGSYPEYPPSPDNLRPFSAQSHDSFNQAPPSLVSGESSYETHETYSSTHPYPNRRPYSLPSFLAPVSGENPQKGKPAIFSAASSSPRLKSPRLASPMLEDPDEVDLSRFPAFSRGWYDEPHKPKRSSLPPYSQSSSYGVPSRTSDSSRNLLPWSSQLTDDNSPPVDDSIKEERIRMLEYEFGKKGDKEVADQPIIGSVDDKGDLITRGPKKRALARWAQAIFALATGASSIYGALFIKSPTPAPPSSQPPAFALYALSIISFSLTFYLFALRPCCCSKRKKANGPFPNMPGGMMVLPVQSGQKKKKKGKKGKGNGTADVHVNLIVDPSMFPGGRRDDYGSDDEGNFDGSQASSRKRGPRNGGNARRSVFQGLALEKEWIAARSFLKKMFVVDILCLIVSAAVFIFVLFGKRCPPGQFNGWCTSYNLATATACFLFMSFGFSVYFDIMDLHASRASPRTRT
ncbi:hypothetical protein BU17DRAFT_78034 [Hysterangium stoloniferum]|nr:hypothetical protein BU17DRAFT_78034 [Hysterangium stoloniferum]